MSRHWPLLPVLVLAAGLRLWAVGTQPVLFFDSGVYLGEGIFLASAAERAAAGLSAPGAGSPLDRIARATEQGTAAHPPDIGKPGHAVLLALAMLPLGTGQAALAGGLVSGLSGIGTVAATYALGVLGWGRRVGLAAALVLAVSGQHLVYSREPLVEADGLLFATLASLVYLRSSTARGLFVAGVLFGAAFTCNNRLSYLPLVLVLTEFCSWPGWRALGRWALPLGVGFVLPPAAIELAYLSARAVGRLTGAATTWLDYAQQLVAFSRMNPPDRIRFDEWPTYFVDVALMDGLVVLGLFVLGSLALLRGRRSRADRLLLASLLIPLGIYSIYSTGEVRMRHFSLALPWVALAAGWGMAVLGDFARRPRLLSAVLTGLVVVLALPRALSLATAPSGMPAVLDALDGQAAAATNGPVLSVFVGEERTNARLRPAFVDTPADLRTLSNTYRWLVVDMQAYLFPGELTDGFDRASPVLSVANGNEAWYLADLLEHRGIRWGGWDDLLAQWDAHRQSAATLRLYAMADVVAR